MNEKDIQIRKQWLLAFAICVTVGAISAVVSQLTIDYSSMPQSPWFIYWIIACTILGLVGFPFLIYHCAYKKQGTKLLTFLLVVLPVSYAGLIGVYWLGIVPLPSYSAGYWAYTALSTGLSIWQYSLHWKLRGVNRRLKALAAGV
jgi:glucan phosphoethanolaminetransferase (alkaline phosphatase superfamily)